MKKNIIIIIIATILILENCYLLIIQKKQYPIIYHYEDNLFVIEPFSMIYGRKQEFYSSDLHILNEKLIGKSFSIDLCINKNCTFLMKGNDLKKDTKINGISKNIYNKKYEDDFYDIENNTYYKIKIDDLVYKLKLDTM